jgi:hypothetical protein
MTNSKSVAIVFVHGLFSSHRTWSAFDRLLGSDPDLAAVERLHFEYFSPVLKVSPLTRIPNFNDIADSLSTYLRVEAAAYRSLLIVSHSQGGLVVQRFLARALASAQDRELARIRGVVTFACPNSGSELGLLLRRGARWWRHPQERELRPINEAIVDAQRIVLNQVVHPGPDGAGGHRIPIFAYAGEADNVVLPASARSVFPHAGVIPGDHFSIIRPDSVSHRSFTTLKHHVLAVLRPERATEAVAARADGPLVRLVSGGGAGAASCPPYVCYLAKERLDTLFAQVDEQTLAARPGARVVEPLPFGSPAASRTDTRRSRGAVGRLATVCAHLDRVARIGDLNAVVAARERLDFDWYTVEFDASVPSWSPQAPAVDLQGTVSGFRLLLSCAKSDFSGLARENGTYIPTSTNRFLFEGEVALPMAGLIRIAHVDVATRTIRATPLFLVLNPLGVDLGEMSDVAL